VALARDGEDPALVLDAGTGLARLTGLLAGRPFRGTIVLGHLHWDHTHGLPFFSSGDHADSDVTVVIPAQGDPEQVLERAISPPHFPITPGQLRGRWRFTGLEPGRHRIEGFDVMAAEIPHRGGRTFGFRIGDGSTTVAYLSDHWPISLGDGPHGAGPYHEVAMTLVRDVDLVIHDAQYTAAELADKRDFGHSTMGYAVGLAEAAGARRLALFHHDPARTDDELDAVVCAAEASSVEVCAAAEGMVIDL